MDVHDSGGGGVHATILPPGAAGVNWLGFTLAIYQLVAVAQKLRPVSPTLAEVYQGLGRGLDSSHYRLRGEYCVTFDLPVGYRITLARETVVSQDGLLSILLRAKKPKTREKPAVVRKKQL